MKATKIQLGSERMTLQIKEIDKDEIRFVLSNHFGVDILPRTEKDVGNPNGETMKMYWTTDLNMLVDEIFSLIKRAIFADRAVEGDNLPLTQFDRNMLKEIADYLEVQAEPKTHSDYMNKSVLLQKIIENKTIHNI